MNQKTQKVGLFEKLVYGSGQVGMNVMYTLFSSYVMIFYTDTIGISASLIGTVILVSKVCDGLSDLVAGQLIDTRKSAKGHCIPVLTRWSLPLLIALALVFMVPDTNLALKTAFIFVTYNLFNTVVYTYTTMAYGTLPTYVTNDPIDRSQMMIYAMLFAGITQTVMASTIAPMLDFFGGMDQQGAWVKSCLVFGVVGVIFLYANCVFVKERVDNPAPPENIIQGVKYAVQNKYWLISLGMCMATQVALTFNLTVSTYYLKDVVGNMGLMGAFIACCNMPGIVMMIFMPQMLKKFSKRSMYLAGTVIMLAANLVFAFSPSGNVGILMGTALIRGIGFGFPMGLNNAMVAECIDYGEWRHGVRVQGPLFSANSVAQKVGQGLLTSLFGFFLTAIGYIGTAEVQAAPTVSGIDAFFKWGPVVVTLLMMAFGWFFDLEKKLPQIREELSAKNSGGQE